MADLSGCILLHTYTLSQGLSSGLHDFGHGDFSYSLGSGAAKEVRSTSCLCLKHQAAGLEAVEIQEMLGLGKVKAAPEESIFALSERRGLAGDPDLVGTCTL